MTGSLRSALLRSVLHFGEAPLLISSSFDFTPTPHFSPVPPHSPKMGLISRVLKVTAAGTVASVGVFFGATRNDVFEPMGADDPIFSSPFFQKFNPERNPTLHDLCVRRVPLDKIQPALLEKKGKLVEAFCAGVWGGMGKLAASGGARDAPFNSSSNASSFPA